MFVRVSFLKQALKFKPENKLHHEKCLYLNLPDYLNSLLSGIVFAYLKTIKYFKIFAHAHTRKKRKKIILTKSFFLFSYLSCARVGRFS